MEMKQNKYVLKTLKFINTESSWSLYVGDLVVCNKLEKRNAEQIWLLSLKKIRLFNKRI